MSPAACLPRYRRVGDAGLAALAAAGLALIVALIARIDANAVLRDIGIY